MFEKLSMPMPATAIGLVSTRTPMAMFAAGPQAKLVDSTSSVMVTSVLVKAWPPALT
jgi:hypothetical protein